MPTPSRLLTILLAFAAALSLTGCVGLTGAGTPAASNNTAASGMLAASATSVTFGNVAVGASVAQTLTLTNSGTAAVNISQANVSGTGFSLMGSASAVAIPAGQSHPFQIQFAPHAPGTVSGSVSVTSDASDPTLSIALTGNATAALAITAQPASQTVTAGQIATFGVTATGNGTLSYIWYKNGVTVSGATSASYTTPATTSSDNGAKFNVTVSDSTGSVTSNFRNTHGTAAAVAPTISSQPASKTVTAGQTATFSVTASGTATLSYQWKKNGAAISGATSASYTTPATVASDNGSTFTVTVTNSVSSVTSNRRHPHRQRAPPVTTQPASKTVTVGQTATFQRRCNRSGNADLSPGSRTGCLSAEPLPLPTPLQPRRLGTTGPQLNVTVSQHRRQRDEQLCHAHRQRGSGSANDFAAAGRHHRRGGTNRSLFGRSLRHGNARVSMEEERRGHHRRDFPVLHHAGYVVFGQRLDVRRHRHQQRGQRDQQFRHPHRQRSLPRSTAQPAEQDSHRGTNGNLQSYRDGHGHSHLSWKKNGAAITGATSASYTTPATVASDNGSYLYCHCDRQPGDVTSSAATLTVTAAPVAPTISTQPASKTVLAGPDRNLLGNGCRHRDTHLPMEPKRDRHFRCDFGFLHHPGHDLRG